MEEMNKMVTQIWDVTGNTFGCENPTFLFSNEIVDFIFIIIGNLWHMINGVQHNN